MPRPNILIICTDQQRFDTVNRTGNPHIITPHLDWLAESGINFAQCYSDAPVCCAARSSMLTGRYYTNLMIDRLGWWGQPTAQNPHLTYPGVLTHAGYQTRAIGKMHFHPARCNYGFESMEILQDYYRYMSHHPEYGVPMDHGLGQNEAAVAISTVDESHSLTHWVVERSIDFLETRDTTRPFLLYAGFSKPHPPFDPCRNYWELYRDSTVNDPVYGDWSEDLEKVPAGFMKKTWDLCGADRFTPGQILQSRRAYYALITQIDYNLGILFARMRELDLLDSTLIIFVSDHGDMLGDHHLWAKEVFLEGSAHVPMLVRPPVSLAGTIQSGSVCNRLVCLADVYATMCSAAGIEIPQEAHCDGIDLLGSASGTAPERTSLVARCGDYHGVIENRYKYLYSSWGGSELLFDLRNDPIERQNILHEQPQIADALRERLIRQLEREQHPDVAGGKLKAAQGTPVRSAARANPWPGFHTRHEQNDVTH